MVEKWTNQYFNAQFNWWQQIGILDCVLARFCSVHNFSFSVDKTKWVVIDFSKHYMNHSPVTIEGTTAEPPSNFQQRQISNFFGEQVFYSSKNISFYLPR